MATDIRSRRMLKERIVLENETTEYACFFNGADMFHFFCYLVGPEDSVYRHKFIKLQFDIPPRYPFVPPKVKFVQGRGERIHPNLYVDGKLCLSILGTWPGEPWATGMTTDSVLRTVQSLLDDHPYTHEPEQQDNPDFNDFVRYSSWRWLLLDYLDNESHPAAKAWLQKHLFKNADIMTSELRRQQARAKQGTQRAFHSPYKCKDIIADYPVLLRDLNGALQASASGANDSISIVSGTSQKPKRKFSTGTGSNALFPPAAQQARVKAQLTEESRQAILASAARTFNQASRSELPQKRAKMDHEVIDLT